MPDLKTLLDASAQRHRDHLCPRQVIGVRMGLYAAELLGLDLPQTDKRVYTFVESDGCLTDGIAVATGCWWGSRTMYLMDYGKTAATFVDTQTERAIRISPTIASRHLAYDHAPEGLDRWHAQLTGYQIMPTEELLQAQSVALAISLKALISHHGGRVVCDQCGEDIINEREVCRGGRVLCQTCAGNGYYQALAAEPIRSILCPALDLLATRNRAGFADTVDHRLSF